MPAYPWEPNSQIIRNWLFVGKNGVDAPTATGSISNPFLTIAYALSRVPTTGPSVPTPNNRWAIMVAAGRYNETVALNLLPNVMIFGSHFMATRIAAPAWGLDPTWTGAGDNRSGVRRLRRLFETTKNADEMAAAATKAFDEKTLRSVVTLWGVWTWSSNIFAWRARTHEENERVQGAYWILRKGFDLSTDMTKYDLAHNFVADQIVEAEPKVLFGCIDPAHGDAKERQVALWDNRLVSIGETKWSVGAFEDEFYVGADGRYEAPLDTNDGWRQLMNGRRQRFNPNERLPGADEYVSIAPETYSAVMEAIGKLPKEELGRPGLGSIDDAFTVVEGAGSGLGLDDDDDLPDIDAE